LCILEIVLYRNLFFENKKNNFLIFI